MFIASPQFTELTTNILKPFVGKGLGVSAFCFSATNTPNYTYVEGAWQGYHLRLLSVQV
jgi:hypothetical protein